MRNTILIAAAIAILAVYVVLLCRMLRSAMWPGIGPDTQQVQRVAENESPTDHYMAAFYFLLAYIFALIGGAA